MKKSLSILSVFFLSLSLLSYVSAKPSKTKSGLNNDPTVFYFENYTSIPIKLLTTKTTKIYSTKKGKISPKIGTIKPGKVVQLIAMNKSAYRISAKGKYGKVKGWVNPKNLASKDPKFIENLQKLYTRQIKVQNLIANNRVAIGMTVDETIQSLGQPTKKQQRITKDGKSGKYEFIEFEKVKHYRYITNHQTGFTYKKLSHVTNEEKSNVTVEFTNNVITAISTTENSGNTSISEVMPPIIIGF